jgi:sulfur transfer complex TusBCD TusB component (DsrH family)
MKVLQVVETAYRATLEEQDDTIIWLTHAMRGAQAELDLLLSGNAVNYALVGQDASGLAFGEWRQTQPPRLADDIAGLIKKGVQVHVVEEDLAERGLANAHLVEGVGRIKRASIPELMEAHDQVWHW